MKKLLLVAAAFAAIYVVGCSSTPAPVVVPQPAPAPASNAPHQVCFTWSETSAVCARTTTLPSGEVHYEVISK